MYLTRWLKPDEQYRARQAGRLIKKTNRLFCEEVKAQFQSDKTFGAEIRNNLQGEIAVFRFDRNPTYRKPIFVQ